MVRRPSRSTRTYTLLPYTTLFRSRELLLIDAVSGDLAALAEENEPIGTVPVFNDIQAFMNIAAEGLLAQIPAQEDRLDRAAQLTQRLVGRVHHLGAAKPAQDRLRVGGFCLHLGCIFDHLVILLLDLIPVDLTGEERLDRKSHRLNSSH